MIFSLVFQGKNEYNKILTISVNELKNGATFKFDNQPFIVLNYEHIKLGRGSAWIKVKIRNLLTGSVTEKSFISGNRVEPIETSRKKYQYLYHDSTGYVFMEPKTFEQISLVSQVLADQVGYLKDGVTADILFLDDKPLTIELPQKMEFLVKEADPGVKGDSASNFLKDAVLDNGLKVRVPLFIEEGEKIIINTKNGEYVERVK
ncbi:elongation factor P [Candidatus Shapirobacteria bacterium CG08_land_8_20_14_0_20_39_18]|uniref:Elongation factor P n=1 Tax=Candidatus Shapirobacteria bacterium CG08_land_8_20_14_0_20_39_18 TaxID=1974883 RepID=A0A2M6XEC2_9BACT|nr:MAG: elongation factor P [Candidatus Shapirobacteria bacterium CG08_land_8_20_14_0_20_39_18]PIY66085.1 MAG: elongation factor P [Candidatus Shapirobacteria bacterium CG_4_10_14_0_8_um_filter_39_15]